MSYFLDELFQQADLMENNVFNEKLGCARAAQFLVFGVDILANLTTLVARQLSTL